MPDGQIALTVRVGADTGERFTAPEAEFDTLVRQAAEAIYRRTQPYRYSIWLRNNDRVEEATEIVSRQANSPNAEDRLWAMNTLASRTPDPNASIQLHERALRIDPEFAPSLYNISNLLAAVGREGEAAGYLSRLLRMEDKARRQLNPARVDQVMLSARFSDATFRRDMPLACKLAREEMDKATDRGTQMLTPLNVAYCLALSRDVAGARQFLADAGLDDPDSMAARLAELSPSSEVESSMALVLEDWERAYLILKEVLVAQQDPDLPYNLMINQTLGIKTQIAEAAAHMGRVAEAREIMATLPPSCEICDRVSGIIEAQAGNAAGARQLFNQAIGDSPNLPATYFDYAQALNILKDWRGAIPQAQKAVALAPKWADPHLAWGDALMGLREPRAAAGRYREATRLAPNWGAAWLGLGEAHAAAGDDKAARDAWETAARLPLSPAGMAKVEQRLRK